MTTLYVVYFGASDRSLDKYTVRAHELVPLNVDPTGCQATDIVSDFDSLEEARAWCSDRCSEGLRVERASTDDPVIVETWW